jgi:uncharacterized protein DUF4062
MSRTSKKNREKLGSRQVPSITESPLNSFQSWNHKRLNRNLTSQVFISSLNHYPLKLSADDKSTLSDFRRQLATKIENEFFFLSADINEDWPAIGAGNPKETTEYLARSCHIFIGILVDDYGFVDHSGLSATHIEFDAAYQDSPEKMLIFIQESLRDTTGQIYKALPSPYRKLLSDVQGYRGGKIVNFFKKWDDLPGLILRALDRYCADSLRAIRRMPAYASDKSTEEATWEQMTFRERYEEMLKIFKTNASTISLTGSEIVSLSHDPQKHDHQRYVLTLRRRDTETHLPIILSACPDRFAYPDAAGYVGYPFRTRVQSWDNPLGPLDIILFFRTATDSQVRRHLGNPDIHVTREDWGYFAADPERYIQAAYLVNCLSSRALEGRVRQFLTWLDEYDQIRNLIARAKIRGRILKAESQT